MKREDLLVVCCKVMLSVVERDEGILFCQREGTPSLWSWPDALSWLRGKMTLVLEVERLTVGEIAERGRMMGRWRSADVAAMVWEKKLEMRVVC